jgi:ornithine cyclodeaminase
MWPQVPPLLVSELTLTTALRTAATSALAAQTLARPNSRVMALIGNGAQSEFQAIAFQHLVGIDTLRLFDIDHKPRPSWWPTLSGSGLKLQVCASIAEAVQGADIVTTVTADKACATIVTADMLAPGMHINAVGGDCPGKTELAADVLQAAKVFVEFTPQTRIEGDIQQMPADFAVTELWEVLNGTAQAATATTQITVFDSVGFALEDFSALRFMHDAALALGLWASAWPDPANGRSEKPVWHLAGQHDVQRALPLRFALCQRQSACCAMAGSHWKQCLRGRWTHSLDQPHTISACNCVCQAPRQIGRCRV